MNRREFAHGLVATALVTSPAASQQNAAAAEADDPPVPQPDQLLGVLKARFGDRLSDEQWKQIRGKIESQLATAKSLGEFKLKNGDEPATVFAAARAD